MKAINLFWAGLFCLLMVNAVNAWTLSHYSRNAYSFEPLANVHVILLNNDTNVTQDGFSDTKGLTDFTVAVEGNYTITASKPAYSTKNASFYLDDSETKISYLTYATENFVKFTFSDMTFKNHEFCFYYDHNNRLYGCYYDNDTIQLPSEYNYTIYPKMNIFEQLGLMSTSASFLIQILLFLIAGGVIVVMGVVILGLGLWAVKKIT
jgi:hypothetical protein